MWTLIQSNEIKIEHSTSLKLANQDGRNKTFGDWTPARYAVYLQQINFTSAITLIVITTIFIMQFLLQYRIHISTSVIRCHHTLWLSMNQLSLAGFYLIISRWIDRRMLFARSHVVSLQSCSFWCIYLTQQQIVIIILLDKLMSDQLSDSMFELSCSSSDLEDVWWPFSSFYSYLQCARCLSAAAAVNDSLSISLGIQSSLCHLSHSVSVRAHFMSRPKVSS